MKFDKAAVQKELDIAADHLERAGQTALATKVDYYAARLMKASAGEIPLLQRAIKRIYDDAQKQIAAAKTDVPKNVEKAKKATTNAKARSEERKAVLERRLKAIASRRARATKALKQLRASQRKNRKARLADD